MRLASFHETAGSLSRCVPCISPSKDVFHLLLECLVAIQATLRKAIIVILLACSLSGFRQMKIQTTLSTHWAQSHSNSRGCCRAKGVLAQASLPFVWLLPSGILLGCVVERWGADVRLSSHSLSISSLPQIPTEFCHSRTEFCHSRVALTHEKQRHFSNVVLISNLICWCSFLCHTGSLGKYLLLSDKAE